MQLDQSVVCPVLIGRTALLTTVAHALNRTREAQGGTLLISGEAGIGKSRLVRAMIESARESGFVTMQGACFEADSAQPYAPVLDLVRSVATVSPALAAHYFAPAGPELVTLFPELRSAFPDVTPRPASDPEEDRRRLFHCLSETIRALGQVQPLLVVIEDVHWSDDATLDLVLHLSRALGTQRATLVLTFRSDEAGARLTRLLADLDRARAATEISLRPLALSDVADMMRAIFGGSTFESSFVPRLHALTEGNPFFVEEVLKALVVGGDLSFDDGAWHARPLEQVRVPRTATEAVGRRLARLSEAAREVASLAAVAGRRFDFDLLSALTNHADHELLMLVKELVDAQLVMEESADRFSFRHALTREAIRTRLLSRERVALHRAIAAALERQHEHGMQDGEDALAYHSFEGGDWESAARHALAAATRAMSLGAAREALQQFERAVTAGEKLGVPASASLLVARGRAHETLGAFNKANDDFTSALAAARAGNDRRGEWVALYALGLLWAARDYERAGTFRHEALEVARSIGDSKLIAQSLNRVGNWYVNREEPHAGIPYHDEALGMFERAGDQCGVAESVDLLAMANHIAGKQDTAVQLYDRSITLFTDLNDRRGLVNAMSVLIVCGPSYHASAGPVSASVRNADLLLSERAVSLAGEIGWRAGEAFSRYLLADCLAWRGEFGRALLRAREALVIAQEIDHLQWQCGALRVLGNIALTLGALPEAVAHLETAYGIALRLASDTWTRWTAAPYAIALAQSGRPNDARAVLDEVDRLIKRSAGDDGQRLSRTVGERYLAIAQAEVALASGSPLVALNAIDERDVDGTPHAQLVRARACIALERWDDATPWLRIVREESLRQHAQPFLWRICALEGTVKLAMRQRLDARRAFDEARSMANELIASLNEPTLTRTFRDYVDTVAPPPAPRTTRQIARDAHGGLTRRERDTATLVAQGKSNRAIARTLSIGERTVEGYVAAALAKLRFTSRSQLAVWAAEQGLVATPVAPRPRS